ncbi:hypothetical protein V2J09_013153 [Rumex salicifolius]
MPTKKLGFNEIIRRWALSRGFSKSKKMDSQYETGLLTVKLVESADLLVEFDRLIIEYISPEPMSRTKEIVLWMQASNDPHNDRIYELGEEGVGLVRSWIINNLNGTPYSSSINTQEFMEPFKKEIREVRDEMKTLQSQNKMLKDMLECLIQQTRGGT